MLVRGVQASREVGRWRKCPRPPHPSWTSGLLPPTGNIYIKELLAVYTLRMMQLSTALDHCAVNPIKSGRHQPYLFTRFAGCHLRNILWELSYQYHGFDFFLACCERQEKGKSPWPHTMRNFLPTVLGLCKSKTK